MAEKLSLSRQDRRPIARAPSSHSYVTRSRISTSRVAMGFVGQKMRNLRPPRKPTKFSIRRPAPFSSATPKLKLGRIEVADALMAGRFEYAGQTLDVGPEGSPWTVPAPSRRFANWLHSFDWLPDLVAREDEASQIRAGLLVDEWITIYGRGNAFAWAPSRLAARLFNWLSCWGLALGYVFEETPDASLPSEAVAVPVSVTSKTANKTKLTADKILGRRRTNAIRQMMALKSASKDVPPGLPQLRMGCALAMGGALVSGTDGSQGFLQYGLAVLERELPVQILADGGHVSRSPEAMVEALKLLLTLDRLLEERGVEGTRDLSRAIDRLAAGVTFFRRATGELAPFHGGGEGSKAQIAKLLAAAPGEPKPFGYCPHTGYQRLAAGGQVLLIDTGSTPPRPFDTQTHLAPLAFDLSTEDGPMITSCGYNPEQLPGWQRPIRSAAAHSTLVLNNRSPGQLLVSEWKRDIIGDAVERPAGPVKATRREQEGGIWLESHHEGYLARDGLAHRRRLFMPVCGTDIRGEDALFLPVGHPALRTDSLPFAIRFHVHPNVRVSLSQDKNSALLVVAGRTGWRFRTDGGSLEIEDSVYLATGATPIKTQQIIIRGEAFCDGDGESRSNRVRWSFRRLKKRPSSPDLQTDGFQADGRRVDEVSGAT